MNLQRDIFAYIIHYGATEMAAYKIQLLLDSEIEKVKKSYEEKLRWISVEEKEPESFKNDEDGIYYSKYLELKVNGYEYPLIGYYVNANDDQFFDIISEKDDDIKQEDITHFRECFL